MQRDHDVFLGLGAIGGQGVRGGGRFVLFFFSSTCGKKGKDTADNKNEIAPRWNHYADSHQRSDSNGFTGGEGNRHWKLAGTRSPGGGITYNTDLGTYIQGRGKSSRQVGKGAGLLVVLPIHSLYIRDCRLFRLGLGHANGFGRHVSFLLQVRPCLSLFLCGIVCDNACLLCLPEGEKLVDV